MQSLWIHRVVFLFVAALVSAPEVGMTAPVDASTRDALAPAAEVVAKKLVVAAPVAVTWSAALQAALNAQDFDPVWVQPLSRGLADADWERWPTELARVVAERRPTAVAVVLGDGDGRDLVGTDGSVVSWGTLAWRSEYARRVEAVVGACRGVPGIWVGPLSHPHANTSLRQAAVALVLHGATKGGPLRFTDAYSPSSTLQGDYSGGFGDSVSSSARSRATGAFSASGSVAFAAWLTARVVALSAQSVEGARVPR